MPLLLSMVPVDNLTAPYFIRTDASAFHYTPIRQPHYLFTCSVNKLQVLTGTIVVPLSEISSPNNLANSFFPFQRLLSLPQEWLLVSFSAFLKSLILTYFIVFYAVLTNYTKKSVNAKEVNFIHPRDLWHSALRGTQSLTV